MHEGAVGVELLRGVAGVVGELLDEVLVAVAEFVLGDVGETQRVLREVLDQVLERLVRHLGLVGPGRTAEDTFEPLRVGRFDRLVGIEECPAYITRGVTHILPAGTLGNGEPVVGGCGGVALVLGVFERFGVVAFPDIRESLEEEQREDVLLVVAGIDEPTQQRGCTPEVGLEFLLGEAFSH